MLIQRTFLLFTLPLSPRDAFQSRKFSTKTSSFREFRSGPFNRKLQEIAREKSDGTEILGKKCPKICVNLARLFSFPSILKNVAPFVTENFWIFDRKGPSIVSCYCSNQLHPVKWSTVKEECLEKLRGFWLLLPFQPYVCQLDWHHFQLPFPICVKTSHKSN